MFDMVKGGIAFALAGVLIALALPPVCTALGFSAAFVANVAATQTIPWCATFFGMIGVSQPLAVAAVNTVFPEKKQEPKPLEDLSMLPAASIAAPPTIAPQHTRSAKRTFSEDGISANTHSDPSAHVSDAVASGQVRTRGLPEQQI